MKIVAIRKIFVMLVRETANRIQAAKQLYIVIEKIVTVRGTPQPIQIVVGTQIIIGKMKVGFLITHIQ